MADTNLDKMNALAQQYMQAGRDSDNARAAAVAQKLGMGGPSQEGRAPASNLYQPKGMTAEEVAERAQLLQAGASPTTHPRLKELNAKYLASD